MGFGLLGSVILLLLVIPMAMIFGWMFPASFGLMLRIARTTDPVADSARERVVVTVRCAPPSSLRTHEPDLLLNSQPISRSDLPAALRAELSRSEHRIVYVEGEGGLETGDIVRVVDLAQGAWPDVHVVLLTPKLQRSFGVVPVEEPR
jgi:biopolymer transport protein ExbD